MKMVQIGENKILLLKLLLKFWMEIAQIGENKKF